MSRRKLRTRFKVFQNLEFLLFIFSFGLVFSRALVKTIFKFQYYGWSKHSVLNQSFDPSSASLKCTGVLLLRAAVWRVEATLTCTSSRARASHRLAHSPHPLLNLSSWFWLFFLKITVALNDCFICFCIIKHLFRLRLLGNSLEMLKNLLKHIWQLKNLTVEKQNFLLLRRM
jgi:hypothetical protein